MSEGSADDVTRLKPRAHHWARTQSTKQRILDASVQVFGTRGFAAATMAEIVATSGASVGSVYHHFGGKDELFLAVHERVATDTEARIAAISATSQGMTRPHIFDLHARAYLEGIYANRDAARVMASGDWPADYDRHRRAAMLHRFRRWSTVMDLASSLREQLLYRILVALMAESVVVVSNCATDEIAQQTIDDVVDYIRRLTHDSVD